MPGGGEDMIDPTIHGGISLEIERCCDCEGHQFCTSHLESRYEEYESKIKDLVMARCPKPDALHIHVNPGPKLLGMDVKRSTYQPCLYQSMVRNHISGRYLPDVCFRYPRIGGFEISIMRGGLRNNNTRSVVFSKLKTGRFPNPEWIAERIVQAVEQRFGGFTIVDLTAKAEEKFATKKMTDEELRKLLSDKFQNLISAFRQFDQNGDGNITKPEFLKGLKLSGIDLPKEQLERLWELADADASGILNFREFSKKFTKYRASHQRNVAVSENKLKTAKEQKEIEKEAQKELAESMALGKHSGKFTKDESGQVIRKRDSATDKREVINESFGVNGEKFDAHKTVNPPSITEMARDPLILNRQIVDCSPDMIRAKIVNRCGGLNNGFRQFDVDNSMTISLDEFEKRLPGVLGVAEVPDQILEEIFDIFDQNVTGEIDLKEFFGDKLADLNHTANANYFAERQAMKKEKEMRKSMHREKAEHQETMVAKEERKNSLEDLEALKLELTQYAAAEESED